MSDETKADGAPLPCACGKSTAGAFTAARENGSKFAVLTLHAPALHGCLEQKVVATWWETFFQAIVEPAERGRMMANQLLAAVVGQLPGKRIRIHAPKAMAEAAATNFCIEVDEEAGGFLNVKSADAPLVVPATSMPRIVT